jgi:hypothetical protein
MIFDEKIELKVYVKQHDFVSDIQTPSRSWFLLCFLHELLMSFTIFVITSLRIECLYVQRWHVSAYDMKFHPKGLWLHCKDHLKWLNNLFYRILVTCSLFKIFNFVSYANITCVTSHHIMRFQKSIVFLTNTYLKNLKCIIEYVLIS